MDEHKIGNKFRKLAGNFVGLPWLELMMDVWRWGKMFVKNNAREGMYEMLHYESTLHLHDPEGKRATLEKRMKVRYLQDNIIAFQDYAWGDGKILQNYRSTPGLKVDQYKLGFKTYILLSLREVKDRGDEDEFHIRWEIRNGFLKPDGYWETSITSRMKRIKVNILFPKDRPPSRISLVESNRRRTRAIGKQHLTRLPDGHWKLTWEKQRPILFEHYTIKWEW